jgi:glutamyl-tRNA reductase
VGLSYRTAPVEVRERLALPESGLGEAIEQLAARPGIEEVLILSTCNRVEVAVTSDSQAALDTAVEFLATARGLNVKWLESYLYRMEDREAIRHLFRVAASLDSMVLGEPQILGQLKAAYAASRERGALSGLLGAVMTHAFSVAKRVRSETGIARSAVSVSYAAVEIARRIFDDFHTKRALLVGAGKMSELAARHLKRAGCIQIYVTNRTRARAEELAAALSGEVIDYPGFAARLHEMDIVLASSGAAEYVLRKDDLRQVLKRRHNRPIYLIDIAVPRNVDPAVNDLDGVTLVDIDDLGREVAENRKSRAREAGQAEQIIDEEIDRLIERFSARSVAPTIVSLQEQLDTLSRAELDKLRARFGPMNREQEQALEAYTRSLLNKIAHGPITELRRAAASPQGEHTIALIRRLFRLESNP